MSTTTTTLDRSGATRALTLGFQAVRLPLTAVETVVRRRGVDWPPAIAFTRVEATLLQVAGGVLHDESLAAEGRRLQAAATKAERATELDADAEHAEWLAEQEREQRLQRAEEAQQRASERADEQREKVAQSASEKRRKSERDAEARKEAARKREEAAQEGLRRRERSDRLTAATRTAEAVESERAALDAQEEVLQLDEALEASRRSRKARA